MTRVSCIVSEVIDGDTFRVQGGWEWNGQNGDLVRPIGYNTPEENQAGYEVATAKLKNLIEGKSVEIGNVEGFSYERLLCKVYFRDNDLADYFPEYKI